MTFCRQLCLSESMTDQAGHESFHCRFQKSWFQCSSSPARIWNKTIINLFLNKSTLVIFRHFLETSFAFSVWRCWLGDRKGIRPVKTEWWVAGMVTCLEQGADLHMAQLMPLPLIVSRFSKIQTGFTLLVPANPGSPRQRAIKRVCVSFL